MGRNLPPGVSVSDLPGNEPGPEPECFAGGCEVYPSVEAMEDGYPLCEDHDTPEARSLYDDTMRRRREEAEAQARVEEAERNAPLPDEPLPSPLVPREVVEDGDPRTDGGFTPSPAPLTEEQKYDAAWHFLRAAKNILPSSGSVSVGPPLGKIEEVQDELMERKAMLPDYETDGGEIEVNPPQGDRTDNPLTDREIRDLIRGAELLRYVPGTEEHAGNVMAVFETPDGRGIGLTFVADPSTYPDDLIGEAVREERPFVRGSGTAHGKAFVLFEDRDAGTEKITIRNTQAVGVYEVDP